MTTISRIHEAIDTLMATPAFQRALDFLEQDSARTVDELKAMAIIHGAPYKEHLQRSPMYKRPGWKPAAPPIAALMRKATSSGTSTARAGDLKS